MSKLAPPALPARRPAVLVIDVQAGPFSTVPPPFESDLVIRRINSVTAKARAAKVPVIFVRHECEPEANWRVPHGLEFAPALKVLAHEAVVRKTTADAFHGTHLEALLRAGRIQTLLLLGYATDFCIDATLRNAASKDFEIIVVSDAHTTNDGPRLKAAAIRRHFNWAWSDSFSSRGIHLLKAAEVSFRRPALSRGRTRPPRTKK